MLDVKGPLESHIPLIDFSYNNIYQATIEMVL